MKTIAEILFLKIVGTATILNTHPRDLYDNVTSKNLRL